jgi:hypothetical protein
MWFQTIELEFDFPSRGFDIAKSPQDLAMNRQKCRGISLALQGLLPGSEEGVFGEKIDHGSLSEFLVAA